MERVSVMDGKPEISRRGTKNFQIKTTMKQITQSEKKKHHRIRLNYKVFSFKKKSY